MKTLAQIMGGLALSAAMTLGAPMPQAFAGEAEAALLKSYAGQFTGRGQLRGKTTESVACRLSLQSSSSQKLRYSGRCVMAGETVPLRGTLSYSDARKRYEATASGMGTVAGQKRGNGVTFTVGRDYRRQGQSGTFNVTFVLSGGAIAIDFAINDRANGAMRAHVPLGRS